MHASSKGLEECMRVSESYPCKDIHIHKHQHQLKLPTTQDINTPNSPASEKARAREETAAPLLSTEPVKTHAGQWQSKVGLPPPGSARGPEGVRRGSRAVYTHAHKRCVWRRDRKTTARHSSGRGKTDFLLVVNSRVRLPAEARTRNQNTMPDLQHFV